MYEDNVLYSVSYALEKLIIPPNMMLVFQAAHAVLQLQETGKPVYKVKNVSLNALCELYNAPVNPMKDQVEATFELMKCQGLFCCNVSSAVNDLETLIGIIC